MTTSKQLSASQRKKEALSWEQKGIADKKYRIRFMRFDIEGEGPSDAAFYFDRQEDVSLCLFWKNRGNLCSGSK